MGRPVLLLLLFSTGLVIVAHGERILKVITNAIPPNDDAVHDQEERDGRFMAASHSNIEETFDRLVSRYSDKLRQRVGARMLSKEIAVKEITGIAPSNSFKFTKIKNIWCLSWKAFTLIFRNLWDQLLFHLREFIGGFNGKCGYGYFRTV